MIFDQTFDLIKRGLDTSVLRHELIAGNIANVSTPNYKRKDLDFRFLMEHAMTETIDVVKTNRNHIDAVSGGMNLMNHVIHPTNSDVKSNGNNVDVDKEIVTMVNNNVYYNTLTTLMSRKIRLMKDAIA